MIGTNFKYNGLDMSPNTVWSQKIALSNVEGLTDQRADIVDNVNDHGSTSSNTLEGGRLITFEGYITGIGKQEKGMSRDLLNKHINIEPYVNKDPFKKLEFRSDSGIDMWVMASVNKKPKGTNGVNDYKILFTFALFADTNELYGVDLHSENGNCSTYGGTSFANSLGDSRGHASGSATCNNVGNFKAGCTINAIGTLVNPRIKNMTNGQEFKINGTTTNLELDSTLGKWSVKDEGVSIMNKRESGVPVYLSPGDNEIIITDDVGATSVFTVSWYDTWNNI